MKRQRRTFAGFLNEMTPVRLFLICAVSSAVILFFMGSVQIFKSVFPHYNIEAEEDGLTELREPEPEPPPPPPPPVEEATPLIITYNNIFDIKSFDIIKKNLYNIDKTAYVYDSELDFEALLNVDTKVDLRGNGEPKVLIFHTHSQEGFADSQGTQEDTIVGVGDYLSEILAEKYGVAVLHHKGVYDMVDGKVVRGGSYEAMEKGVQEVLKQYPSIEVMIDLHRDSLPNDRRLITTLNGKPTAQIMYFNGICRLNENGEPASVGLINDYITENLALSLRMKLLTNELYPDLSRKNYIKPYRYSLHMRPFSLLIEVGSDTNTFEEAKNAMEPLADILVRAFS